MAAVDTNLAMSLVKARLNRTQGDTSLDTYFQGRVNAAIQTLTKNGITLTDSQEDLMLVVDYAVWAYQNRDKPGGMPEWLKLVRRERWLRTGVST